MSPSRYLRLLLATMASVLLGVLVLNVVGDPNRVWGFAVLPPDPNDPRSLKLSVLEDASGIEALILGDSRAQRLEPAYVEQRTGLRTFNGAVTGTSSPAMQAIARAAVKRNPGTLRHALILFHGETVTANEFDPPSMVRRLGQALSLDQVRTSLGGALARLGVQEQPVTWRYAADGRETYTSGWDFDDSWRRGGPTRRSLDLTAKVFRKHWRARPSDGDTRRFEAILALLERHHVRITLVLVPYHPDTLRRGGADLAGMHRDFVAYLADLRERHRFRVVDLTTLRFPVRGYADGVHMSERNMRALFDAVLERTAGAL